MSKKLNIKKLAYYIGGNIDLEILQHYYYNNEVNEYIYFLINNFLKCEGIKKDN